MNPTNSFTGMNHVLRLVQELSIKSKTVMSWSLREKKSLNIYQFIVY